MTVVSNEPIWWPLINAHRICSYVIVASATGLLYDFALTFGQEVELIWKQRWSLMTVMYLSVRYGGMIFIIDYILVYSPTTSVSDLGCRIMFNAQECMVQIINILLGVIIIARLYAMYQQSRKVLILLVTVFLAVRIASTVITVIALTRVSMGEFVFSGTYACIYECEGDALFLNSISWIPVCVWEVLTLCLAAWIAFKHSRGLKRSSATDLIGGCYTILVQTHVTYFASILAICCFELGYFAPALSTNAYSPDNQVYFGFVQIAQMTQMYVVGPRLILSVREHNAKVANANSDAETGMTSIVFLERVHVSTSSSV